jgi:cytochrome-b5 reductase
MGPAGGFYYTPNEYAALGLIAGGTGITPILSLIVAVLTNSSDRSLITLVYATSSEQDTMFHEELDELARQYPQKLQVKYVAGSGRVTRALLRENLPGPGDQSLVALCGPTGFCTSIQKSLAKLNYEEHNIFTFGETDK